VLFLSVSGCITCCVCCGLRCCTSKSKFIEKVESVSEEAKLLGVNDSELRESNKAIGVNDS